MDWIDPDHNSTTAAVSTAVSHTRQVIFLLSELLLISQ